MIDLHSFLCFNMRAAMKKIDKNLGQQLEPFGVSIPQSFILKSLLEEDGTTLKEIGTRTLIDSSSMTVLVDKLEKDKLVERQLDVQDRRAIRVFITESGRELAEKVLETADAFNHKLSELVGEENEDGFWEGVNNIIKGME